MRVENWQASEVLASFKELAFERCERVMDDVVKDAKARCPVGTTTVPDGWATANVSFIPQSGRNKGKLVQFGTQHRWKGRYPGQLRNTIRRKSRRDKNNVRVYAGNYKVYYALFIEKGFHDRGGKFHAGKHFLQAPFHAKRVGIESTVAKTGMAGL